MEPDTATYRTRAVRSRWQHILLTALLVGTLDMLAAIIVYQANAGRMFRFIASAAFGTGAAFSGGPIMVVWGIAFHYFIAFAWTAALYFVYPVLPKLWNNKYVTGALYGIVIWVIMNKIVIPLSAISPGPFDFKSAAIGALILIFAVGLPIAVSAHRYYARKGTLPDA